MIGLPFVLRYITKFQAGQFSIEAYPVLVNTQARHTIEDWQPAADLFDHCIAVVRVDNQIW